MPVVNRVKGEISLKIVYLGVSGAGEKGGEKSLSFIHSRLKPELRGSFRRTPFGGGELVQTDFFLSPSPETGSTRLRCHLYAPVGIGNDRPLVEMLLKGADGVVITMGEDSAPRDPEGIRRLVDETFPVDQIPVVIQRVAPVTGVKSLSVPPDWDMVAISLVNGDGIIAAFSRLVGRIRGTLARMDQISSQPVSDDATIVAGETDAEDQRDAVSRPFEETPSDDGPAEGEWEFPLELTVGGEKKRLLVSIRIREEGEVDIPLAGGGYVR